MAFRQRQGGNKGASKSRANTTGGNDRIGKRKNNNAKADKKKIKAAAPTAEELDSELMKYMGNEQVAKTLDGELDEYFKSTETV